MECLSCHTENKAGAKFCAKCGGALAASVSPNIATKPCATCGHACNENTRFCPKCGSGFSENIEQIKTGTSLITANATPATAAVPVAIATPSAEPVPEPAAVEPLATEPGDTPKIVPPHSLVANAIIQTEPCPHCTSPVKLTALFCGKCGNAIARDNSAIQHESPPEATAIVLAVSKDQSSNAYKTKIETVEKPIAKKGMSIPAIVAIAVTAIGLLGAGGYYATHAIGTSDAPPATPEVQTPAALSAPTTGTATITESTQEATPTAPTIDEKSAVPVPLPPPVAQVPAQTQPEAAATVMQTPPPAVAPIPKVIKPKPVIAAKPVMGGSNTALEHVINDSLGEASLCMSRSQYDCVIANANAVLRMDSGNRRAMGFKRQAKQAQDRALSQIQIQ